VAISSEGGKPAQRSSEMSRTQVLAEPISIEAVEEMQTAIQAIEAYHADTYGDYDEDGWLVKQHDCGDCEHCQAVRAMKKSINSIYTIIGYDPIYSDD
jgi:ferredoxin-like protein FixX